jgi:Sas10/Utp3/C1D family
MVGARRLGDRLFSDKKDKYDKHLKSLLQEVKSKSLRQQVLDKELPELRSLMEDLELSLQHLTTLLGPLKSDLKLKQANRPLAAFVDLKYNLLLSYATYLTFYLLLRVEGVSNNTVRDHPVLFKITTLKSTLEGLRGLDDKLERVLKRKAQGKGYTMLGKRVKREEEDESEQEDKEAKEKT